MRPPARILSLVGLRGLAPKLPLLPTVYRAPRPCLKLLQPRRLLPFSLHRFINTQPPPHAPSSQTPPNPPSAPPTSLSGRLKGLIAAYGWYALGVYTVLTVLDFGVAFAAVQLLGADQVSRATHYLKDWVKSLLGRNGESKEVDGVVGAATGVGHSDLWAMVVLAYGIHKTLFLPVRVGLTAAITPRFVGWLRTRGWTGAGGATRAADHARTKMDAARTKMMGPKRQT